MGRRIANTGASYCVDQTIGYDQLAFLLQASAPPFSASWMTATSPTYSISSPVVQTSNGPRHAHRALRWPWYTTTEHRINTGGNGKPNKLQQPSETTSVRSCLNFLITSSVLFSSATQPFRTEGGVVEPRLNPFGNYLCQKLLEFSNDEQRTVLITNAAFRNRRRPNRMKENRPKLFSQQEEDRR